MPRVINAFWVIMVFLMKMVIWSKINLFQFLIGALRFNASHLIARLFLPLCV